MPFQSEKQRRYLWANEPEIARDWTDTYGSGIAKALGGRIPFQQGGRDVWNIKYGTDQTLREHGDQGWVGGPLKEYNPALDLNKPYRLAMNEYLKSNQPISYSETETIPNPDYYGLNIGRNYIPTEEIPLQVGPYTGERYSIKDMRGIGGLEQLIGDDDDETGTITFDPRNPQLNRAGLGVMSLLKSTFGPKIAAYLKNRALTKTGKTVGPKIRKTGKDIFNPPKTPTPPHGGSWHPGVGGNGGTGSPGGGAQAAGDLAGGSAYSSPFNRGGLAWLR
jgi:hypothetical protein